jgi:hypothetical protein
MALTKRADHNPAPRHPIHDQRREPQHRQLLITRYQKSPKKNHIKKHRYQLKKHPFRNFSPLNRSEIVQFVQKSHSPRAPTTIQLRDTLFTISGVNLNTASFSSPDTRNHPKKKYLKKTETSSKNTLFATFHHSIDHKSSNSSKNRTHQARQPRSSS